MKISLGTQIISRKPNYHPNRDSSMYLFIHIVPFHLSSPYCSYEKTGTVNHDHIKQIKIVALQIKFLL